jgi:glyoxylase-like metal-dependent hydrolase (beta-lactamase superfamily II)/rhodanese-related sulfurtransferase
MGAYTYLLANRPGGEALIIDPVLEKVGRYVQLLDELGLKLVKAVDTHVHADHITGLGALRDATRCITVMGRASKVDQVSMRVDDGDTIDIDGLSLEVLYTPGHTDDSYCFVIKDRVFTGDTLLIRGTGRTDFQNGDPTVAYGSLFDKLLTLPDDTLVYPGHDYKGDSVSTIGEEKAHNPRLQVGSAEAYAELMDNLGLDNPKMMDVAVPANLSIGYASDAPAAVAGSLEADVLLDGPAWRDVIFVDLREDAERQRDGIIPDFVHAPYGRLPELIKPGGMLNAMASQSTRPLVLYCAFGERSALSLETAREAGIDNVCHLAGGFQAWAEAGGKVER